MSRVEVNTKAISDGQITTPDLASGAVTAGKIANPLASLTVNNLTAGGLTFPTSDGANGQVLTTDGNGTLSFASGGSSASGINADGDLTAANVTVTDTLIMSGGTGGAITGANSITANTITATDRLTVAGGTGGTITGASSITANTITASTRLSVANGTGGTITGANSITVSTSFNIGSWEIKLDSNDLRFCYNGTDVFKITTTGDIIAAGNVRTNGSP